MRYAVRIVVNGIFDAEPLGDSPKETLEGLVEDAISRHVPHFEGEAEVTDVAEADE